jgi:hypothetical protein
LGIRTAIEEDLNAAAAKMTYGAGIRLLGCFRTDGSTSDLRIREPT